MTDDFKPSKIKYPDDISKADIKMLDCILSQEPILDVIENTSYINPTNNREYLLDDGDTLHFHHELEIGICTNGEGISLVENTLSRFTKGSVLFILPGQPHCTFSTGKEYSSWKWIFIKLSDLNRPMLSTPEKTYLELLQGGIGASGLFYEEYYPDLQAQIIRLFDDIEQKEYEDVILTVIQCLLYLRKLNTENRIYLKDFKKQSKILKAQAIINGTIKDSKPVNVTKLASELGYSPQHFRRCFKEQFGIAPKEYIMQLTINKACQLLIHSEMSVEEIADNLGFADVSGFYKSFSNYRNMSPREYRLRWQ